MSRAYWSRIKSNIFQKNDLKRQRFRANPILKKIIEEIEVEFAKNLKKKAHLK